MNNNGDTICLLGQMKKDEIMIINLSGRGDKDMNTAYKYFG